MAPKSKTRSKSHYVESNNQDKALDAENGKRVAKTTSRPASPATSLPASRAASPAPARDNSRAASPANSRRGSRAGSLSPDSLSPPSLSGAARSNSRQRLRQSASNNNMSEEGDDDMQKFNQREGKLSPQKDRSNSRAPSPSREASLEITITPSPSDGARKSARQNLRKSATNSTMAEENDDDRQKSNQREGKLFPQTPRSNSRAGSPANSREASPANSRGKSPSRQTSLEITVTPSPLDARKSSKQRLRKSATNSMMSEANDDERQKSNQREGASRGASQGNYDQAGKDDAGSAGIDDFAGSARKSAVSLGSHSRSADSHVGSNMRSSRISSARFDSHHSSSIDAPKCTCGTPYMSDSNFCRMCGKRRAAVEQLDELQDSVGTAQLSLPGSDDQMRLLKKKEKKPPGHNITLAFEIYPVENQRLDMLNTMVVKIQARWRGVSARMEWGSMVDLRRRAALKIQAYKKGKEARRNAEKKKQALIAIQTNLRFVQQRRGERIQRKKSAQVKARQQRDPKQLLIDAFNAALRDLWNRDRYNPEVAASNLGQKLASTTGDVVMTIQDLNQIQVGVDREQLSKICASMDGLVAVFKLSADIPITPLHGARDLFEEMLETAGNDDGMIGFEELRAIHAGRNYSLQQARLDGATDRRDVLKEQQDILKSLYEKCPKIEGTTLVDKAEIVKLCGCDREICKMFGLPKDVTLTPVSGTREVFDKILHVVSKARRESLPPIGWNEFFQLYEFPEMSTGRVEGVEIVTNKLNEMMVECPQAWPRKVHTLIQDNLLKGLLKVDSMMTTFDFDGRVQSRDETEKRLERLKSEKAKLDEKMEIVTAKVELEARGIFPDDNNTPAIARTSIQKDAKKITLSARERRKAEKAAIEVSLVASQKGATLQNVVRVKDEAAHANNSVELMEMFRLCIVDGVNEVRRYKQLLDGASRMITSVKDKLYETGRESAFVGNNTNDKFRVFLTESHRVIEHVIGEYLKEAANLEPLVEERMRRHPWLLLCIRSHNAALENLLSKRLQRANRCLETHRELQESYECNIEDAEMEIQELQTELEEMEEEWQEEPSNQSIDIAEGMKVVEKTVEAFSEVLNPILNDLVKTLSSDRSQAEQTTIDHLLAFSSLKLSSGPGMGKHRPNHLDSFTTPTHEASLSICPPSSQGSALTKERTPSRVRFKDPTESAGLRQFGQSPAPSRLRTSRMRMSSSMAPGADGSETEISETATTDDVSLSEMPIYARTLATILSKGDGDQKNHIQLFLESCVADGSDNAIYQSDIPPLITPMKDSDGPAMQRTTVTLTIHKKGDTCQVSHKSVCTVLRDAKDEDESSSKEPSQKQARSVEMFLTEVELFKRLPAESLTALAKVATAKTFAAGDIMIKQGDSGNELFMIKSGIAHVEVDGEIVATLKPGDYFGENSLISSDLRNATIACSTKVAVFTITRKQFFNLGLNEKLEFPKRMAVAQGADHDVVIEPPTPKTPEEEQLIINAVRVNKSLAFMRLTEHSMKEMAAVAWKVNVASGTEIITQGDVQAAHFYVVQDGSFLVSVVEESIWNNAHFGSSRDSRLGKLIQAHGSHTIAKGGSFGALALLYNSPRAATVTAKEPSAVWVIARPHFKGVLLNAAEQHIGDYVRYLNNVEVTQDLPGHQKEKIAKALVEMTFKKGDEPFKQGDKGDMFYILIEGTIDMIKDGVSLFRHGDYYPHASRLLSV